LFVSNHIFKTLLKDLNWGFEKTFVWSEKVKKYQMVSQ